MDREKLKELFCQAIETEKGGVLVYDAALKCVVNHDLKEEWTKYRDQTQEHVDILQDVVRKFGFDPDQTTPGSEVVKLKGESLVKAVEKARGAGDPAGAQLVAAECVIDAETKDHLNWELLGETIDELEGEEAEALQQAFDKIEEEEDEHLYHTMGWCRELWLEFMGLPAVLPPPEEKKRVKTLAGEAQVKRQRTHVMRKTGAGGRRRSARPSKTS